MKKENDYLKRENEFLKSEFIKLTGRYPSIENLNLGEGMGGSQMVSQVVLPPINNSRDGSNGRDVLSPREGNNEEVSRLKEENSLMKKTKEVIERQNANLVNENLILSSKLNNLENVFIGSSILRNKDGSVSNDMGDNYNMSAVC